jgi:N-methylhydantoinase B/oxoprolinase/acetone carboxylase alpha subunit
MSEAVRYQAAHYAPGGAGAGDPLRPGDVLCSNHPQLAGGSHLPDITVISPVFEAGGGVNGGGPVFFVASRGHHADIGGISPGSMPPASKVLEEEGAAIVSFKLVRAGAFQVRVCCVFCCVVCFVSELRLNFALKHPPTISPPSHPPQTFKQIAPSSLIRRRPASPTS